MSKVTPQEIVEVVKAHLSKMGWEYASHPELKPMFDLFTRIEANGIAPPDGLELIADIEGIGCCTVVIRSGRVNIASETVRDIIRMGAGKVAPPDGMVLVPKEPTQEMIDAGIMFGTSPTKVSIIWGSMLSAAPEVKP